MLRREMGRNEPFMTRQPRCRICSPTQPYSFLGGNMSNTVSTFRPPVAVLAA